eukprot:gene25506-30793_t
MGAAGAAHASGAQQEDLFTMSDSEKGSVYGDAAPQGNTQHTHVGDGKETLPHLRMKRIASRRMSAGAEGQTPSQSNQLALEMLSHHTPGGLSSGSRRFSRL